MVEPTLDWTFPFGRPMARRRPSAKSKRRVFVLGALPSALHIDWWSPARKRVKALPVDNEPAALWNGADEKAEIEAWKKVVGFRVGEWGEVETAGEMNGKAGRWLDAEVLAPLGVTREEACLSYCVDTYFADSTAGLAVRERYQPVAGEVALPQAQLPPRPRDGGLVALAVEAHRERLLHELSVVVPELVITLGNVALRVLRAITEAKGGLAKLHPDARYGVEQPLVLGKRQVVWLPLTLHETPPLFAEAHALWRQNRPR
jgi:uracil-DNA glycosylase